MAQLSGDKILRYDALSDLEKRKLSYAQQIIKFRDELLVCQNTVASHNIEVKIIVAETAINYLESTIEQISTTRNTPRNQVKY